MSNANLYDTEIPGRSERQVVRWTAEMLGLPLSASGLVVIGTSITNLVAVLAARAGARSGQPAGRHQPAAADDLRVGRRAWTSARCG